MQKSNVKFSKVFFQLRRQFCQWMSFCAEKPIELMKRKLYCVSWRFEGFFHSLSAVGFGTGIIFLRIDLIPGEGVTRFDIWIWKRILHTTDEFVIESLAFSVRSSSIHLANFTVNNARETEFFYSSKRSYVRLCPSTWTTWGCHYVAVEINSEMIKSQMPANSQNKNSAQSCGASSHIRINAIRINRSLGGEADRKWNEKTMNRITKWI